jgi:peptidyl-prolyl cis-trans isomerase A (cyclophilin A)
MSRLLPLLALALACGGRPDRERLLDPSLASDVAPRTFRVRFDTTQGAFLVDVYRDWAPHGADRFYNLVKMGYFTDCAFFRVLPELVQVGWHGDPRVNAVWSAAAARLPAERPAQSNRRGFVALHAHTSDGRTTQVVIHKADNLSYDRTLAPFGQVVGDGMAVVDRLFGGYGDCTPHGSGPAQSRLLFEGNAYLRREFPDLDYVRRVSVVE